MNQNIAISRQNASSKVVHDVIVVGGGGCGFAAAVSSAETGLRVLLLEKNLLPGGTTSIAIGSFTGAETALQRREGIVDCMSWHVEDAARFAPPEIEARNNAELRAWFLSQTAETYAWLEKLGLVFHGPNPEPPNRVSRMHNVVPNAKADIAAMAARLKALGGEIRCQVKVHALQQEQGRVIGVVALTPQGEVSWRARRGVVLATGGDASGQRLLAEFKGPQYADIDGVNPTATGDGHERARQAGAMLYAQPSSGCSSHGSIPRNRCFMTARFWSTNGASGSAMNSTAASATCRSHNSRKSAATCCSTSEFRNCTLNGRSLFRPRRASPTPMFRTI